MTNKVPARKYFFSPYGVVKFGAISSPSTRFEPSGEYSIKLAVPAEDAAEAIAYLEGIRDEKATPNLTPHPVVSDEVDENGTPTGNVIFKAKAKAHVIPRNSAIHPFDQHVVVVDEDNNTVTEPVWRESVVRFRAEVIPYANPATQSYGVSLRLKGVQVRELVTGEGGGTGFEDVSGTMPGHAS